MNLRKYIECSQLFTNYICIYYILFIFDTFEHFDTVELIFVFYTLYYSLNIGSTYLQSHLHVDHKAIYRCLLSSLFSINT